MVRRLAWLGLLLLAGTSAAQVPPDTTAAPEADALEALAETGDAEELADVLADLRADGLDLNSASANALADLPALSPLLARRIVAYRDSIGGFASLPEVQRVPGVTPLLYAEIRPYLRLGRVVPASSRRPSRYPLVPPRRAWRAVDGRFVQRYSRRLETARGYAEGRYAGSPDKLYTRLRLRSARRLSVNLTMEKDAGEAFAWQPATGTYGYDYVSASVALEDVGRVRAAVAGDFTASFGQGLVLWRSAALGKSRDATRGLVRTGGGLTPYGSTDENRFFRGGGATLLLTPRLAVTAFYSRRTLDASILDADTGGVGALGASGLHRTEAERLRKDALGEQAAGGAVEYRQRALTLGGTYVATRYDDALVPRSAPDARFAFRGRTAQAAGVFGQAVAGPALVFGEAARAQGAWAFVGGAAYAPERLGEVVVLVRHYPARFASLHGHAFGERMGATQNESGLYLGLRVQPRRGLVVQAYADAYRFPWLRFNVPRPTSGLDALVSVAHAPHPWLRHEVTLRAETREEAAVLTDARGGSQRTVRPETRRSLRWQGVYAFSRALTLRTRVEGVAFEAGGEPARGVLVYQDVRLAPTRRLLLETRLALFRTDGYAARLYAYEYDVRYGFGVPAFFGRGTRQYALLRYDVGQRLSLEARYAATYQEDVAVLGSGLDETPGGRAREIKAQLVWRW